MRTFPIPVLAILTWGLLTVSPVWAQKTSKPAKLDLPPSEVAEEPTPEEPDEDSLVEGSPVESEIKPEPIPDFFGFSGGFRAQGTSARSAGSSTLVEERGRDGLKFRSANIVQDEERIEIKITRWVSRKQWEVLWESAPKISEYAESFPTESGEYEVDILVGLSKTFEADSQEEFDKKYPELSKHYMRYMRGGMRMGMGGARLKRGIEGIPPLPIRPMAIDSKLVTRSFERMKDSLQKQISATTDSMDELKVAKAKASELLGTEHPTVKSLDIEIDRVSTELETITRKFDVISKALDKTLPVPDLAPPAEDKDDQ